MFECSSLALYERFERKQGLSSLLYLKCSTSSCRYIQQFFTSAKVATEVLMKLINKLFTRLGMQSSAGHGYAGIQKLNNLMNIPKRMTKNYNKKV